VIVVGEDVVEVEDTAGRGWKVRVTLNETPWAPHPMPPPAEPPCPELWRATALTPSMRRRRLRAWATPDWLVEHAPRVNTGTLPGGVDEATAEPAAAPLAAGEVVDSFDPMVPVNDVIDASVGRTRPSSLVARAQSKRDWASSDTIC